MRMDEPDRILCGQGRNGRIELQYFGTIQNTVRHIQTETLFEFAGIAIKHEQERVEAVLLVQHLQLAKHSRAIAAGPREVAVRENQVQRAIPICARTRSAADLPLRIESSIE